MLSHLRDTRVMRSTMCMSVTMYDEIGYDGKQCYEKLDSWCAEKKYKSKQYFRGIRTG